MCTKIRFLGWAPGSRVPSQAPTISGSPAAIMGSGMIANPGISVNPNQSPNDNARYLFMVDLLIELQPKSARSQSGITLFRCLSPTTAIVEFRLLVSAMQILPESPFMASWLPQAYTRLWPASAVAGRQERERPQGVNTDRPCPLLREHAAVLLHKPELTRGSQRPYRRLSGHWPQSAFEEVSLSQCPRAVSVLALSEGHSPVSGTPQEPAIGAVVVRAPRLETTLLVELIRKVDVGPAVQQIPQVQSGPRQVHRVDLERAPIQGAVGVVVIDFASSLRILGALNCEGNPAGRAEFVAGVLLVGR